MPPHTYTIASILNSGSDVTKAQCESTCEFGIQHQHAVRYFQTREVYWSWNANISDRRAN